MGGQAMSALSLGLRLVPVQRLNVVALGIVAHDDLQDGAITYTHLRRDGVHKPSARSGDPHSGSFRFLLSLHADKIHWLLPLLQHMSIMIAVWLHFVKQSSTILVTIIDFSLEFVAGLQAQDGLSRKGELPATGEPATSSVVLFLRCF
jgi:hypothetical protein